MCTAATYKTYNFYFGRTLDYEFSYGEHVTITPRNYPIRLHGGALDRHYAMIGMAHIQNDITVLDITGPSKATVKGLTNPNVSDLHREYLPKDAVKGDALKAALAGRGKSGKTAAVTDGGAGNDAAPGAK